MIAAAALLWEGPLAEIKKSYKTAPPQPREGVVAKAFRLTVRACRRPDVSYSTLRAPYKT